MLVPEQYCLIYASASNLFAEEHAYVEFLGKLSVNCAPFLQVLAYCLVPDGYTILAETTDEVSWEKELKELNLLDRKFQVFEEPAGIMVMSGIVMRIIKENLFTGAEAARIAPSYRKIDPAEIKDEIIKIHRIPALQGLPAGEWKYSSYHALTGTRPTRLAREKALSFLEGTPLTLE